jgi:hypothetical protein
MRVQPVAAWPPREDTLTARLQVASSEVDPQLPGFTRWRLEGLTVFRVQGEATSDGFLMVFRGFLFDPTPQVLWDLREYSLFHLPLDEMRWLVGALTRLDLRKRPRGRSAFVCSSDEEQAHLRVFTSYAEANDYPIKLAVFGDMEQAKGWLTADLPSRGSE